MNDIIGATAIINNTNGLSVLLVKDDIKIQNTNELYMFDEVNIPDKLYFDIESERNNGEIQETLREINEKTDLNKELIYT